MATNSDLAVRERENGRLPGWTLWLGVGVWITAPLLILSVLGIQNRAAEFVSFSPAWTPVMEPAESIVDDVDLALKWDPGGQLLAPAWHGVVQSVHVSAGGAVSNGTSIATVDGVNRIAWQTPGAFYRPLQLGDTGDDVTWLKSILRSRGSPLPETNYFDWATLVAVRNLAGELGVSKPASVPSFDPTWVVFLPAAIPALQSVTIASGAPASPAGSVIAKGVPILVEATVDAPSSSTDSASGEPGSDELARIQYATRVATGSIALEPGSQLTYAGSSLAWDGMPSKLDSPSLQYLTEALTPKVPSVPAQLHRVLADGELEIPSAAIASSSSSGVICTRLDDVVREVKVKVLSDKFGITRVIANISGGTEVRVPGPSVTFPCEFDSTD